MSWRLTTFISYFQSYCDRFLIEWNKAIFGDFVPSAWAKMLEILVKEDNHNNIWSAWPDCSSPVQYWGTVARKLLLQVTSSGYCIFPTLNRDIPTFVPLSSALVASPSDSPFLLWALDRAGVNIIKPPDHLFTCEFRPRSSVSEYNHKQ